LSAPDSFKQHTNQFAAYNYAGVPMLKIGSGRFCGRNIEAPPGRGTRPPLARIRKAVMDTLRPYIDGAMTLDLFGGSGSYSFESLSNGAARATIIELSGEAARVISGNARFLDVESQMELVRGDAFKVIPRLHGEGRLFDVLFIAPPQRREMVVRSLEILRSYPLFNLDAIIVCQFETKEVGDLGMPPFAEFKRKIYGRTELAFLEIEP